MERGVAEPPVCVDDAHRPSAGACSRSWQVPPIAFQSGTPVPTWGARAAMQRLHTGVTACGTDSKLPGSGPAAQV